MSFLSLVSGSIIVDSTEAMTDHFSTRMSNRVS